MDSPEDADPLQPDEPMTPANSDSDEGKMGTLQVKLHDLLLFWFRFE